jgi:hypothetical protein
MARTRSTVDFSLAQLERLVKTRRTEMIRLTRQRDRLQKRLDGLNDRISEIAGGAGFGGNGGRSVGSGGGGGGRARNDVSLQDAIHQVLSKASAPMGVGDIMDKVRAAGYRSNSANFRGIVNQTLIKDKRFTSAARGVYQLKK